MVQRGKREGTFSRTSSAFRRLHVQSFGVVEAEAEAVVPVEGNRGSCSRHLEVELDLDVTFVRMLFLVVRTRSARRRLG